MKRFNGTVVQQLVNVKSIVVMVLIMAAFLGVACSDKSATSTDVGGKGREIVKTNTTSNYAKEDVGGSRGQEIRFSLSNEQPAILILEVGGKSSSGSQMVTTLHDVGCGKSVSTTKNALADVGGRNSILTGNLYLVVGISNDVGGGRSSTGTLQVSSLNEDVGGKGINQNFSVRNPTSYLMLDVGGGKTVSTTKNATLDVGGCGTILTGNVVVVFQNGEDVGGKSTGVMRIYAKTPYTEVGGKEIKNMRIALSKTDFS
ncbi:MAG: hypothetical protein JNJ52_04050 [Flavobacterium sp.]|nr:hypothetical protein [Flavobacterium sp.]